MVNQSAAPWFDGVALFEIVEALIATNAERINAEIQSKHHLVILFIRIEFT